MTNTGDTDSTDADKGGDTGDGLHGGSAGHASDVPENSPSTESENSLSEQVANRGSDGEQDDE